MTSTTELLSSELGKAFLEAKERADRVKMFYRKNEIGEDIIVEWNPYKKLDKNPYAVIVAQAYDEMVKNTIPKDALLSASFQNWIIREKNELIVDSRIAKDDYFKSQINFETGEVTQNRGNDILKAKMSFLINSLDRLHKAFTTHMNQNADKAFADEQTLKKYESYYQEQTKKVNERLERGDYSYYDKKDKEGNITQAGSEEDAKRHKENIDTLLSKVGEARKEQEVSETSDVQMDFVGDNLNKMRRM